MRVMIAQGKKKKKSQYFPSSPLYIISFPIPERMERITAMARSFASSPAAPYITATAPNFKLHPLPCQKLGIGIDSLWRNYSSATIIYCGDKRVGAFAFGGIFGDEGLGRSAGEKRVISKWENRAGRLEVKRLLNIRGGAEKSHQLLFHPHKF